MSELVFPASLGQRRLWFLDRANDRSGAAYTIAARLDVSGPFSVVAMQSAVNMVVARHEALRTALRTGAADLEQVVMPSVTVSLRAFDLSALLPKEIERRGAVMMRAECRRLWNLAQAPLLRALVLRTAEDRHALVISVHHAVCDGLSLGVLLAELIAAYDGQQMPEAALQFADYVVWSSRDEPGQGTEPARYWRDELAGAPLVLELPTDRRRPGHPTYDGARHAVRVDPDLAARVRRFGTRRGATTSAVLLTAFLVVLHRLSGAADLVVGVPVANRARPELADVVGYLATTGVLRSDVRSGPSLGELLAQVQDRLTGMIDHAGIPFDRLVEMLAPPRLTDRNPAFQVMFGFQQDVQREVRLGTTTMSVSDVDNGTARVDLSLFLFEERAGAVTGFFEYATDLFDRATVERAVAIWETVLDALLADPDEPVLRVRLGPDPEVLRGAPLEVAGVSLPQRLAALAQERPAAPAVCDDETTLDFAALDERVDAAAALLQEAGVTPGDHVAVELGRSVSVLIALFACWRIGAVYVPLDPALPRLRRQEVLTETRPAAIVEPAGVDLRGAPAARPTPVSTTPDDIAYTMFTSGSTGRPKGVELRHRNLTALLAAVAGRLGWSDADRMLALTTFSFDISLLELLGVLVLGGTTVVAGDEVPARRGTVGCRAQRPDRDGGAGHPGHLADGPGCRLEPAVRVADALRRRGHASRPCR